MNAANITASIAAATFSARRRSQPPSARITRPGSLERVDLLEHALRPFLRLVRGEVDLLCMRAERVQIRRVDLQALLAEALGQLRLALLMLGRAPGDRLVGRRLERLLLFGRHAIPGFQV